MSQNAEYVYKVNDRHSIHLVSCEDRTRGFITRTSLANANGLSYPATTAWALARFSRSGKNWEELFEEIYDKSVDPQQKLAETFIGYGHASVGDMAMVSVSIEGIPIHVAANIFNKLSTGQGQEVSTRYQVRTRFGNLPNLEHVVEPSTFSEKDEVEWKQLATVSLGFYIKWREKFDQVFKDIYKPNMEDKEQVKAFTSRVLDSARYFLLAGFPASMGYVTSAREWSTLIKEMRGGRLKDEVVVADLIEALLNPKQPVENYKPEVDLLTRHTQPTGVEANNLSNLAKLLGDDLSFKEMLGKRSSFSGHLRQTVELLPEDILQEDKIIAQFVLTLHPDIPLTAAIEWARTLGVDFKTKIGEIIFGGHNNYDLPPVQTAVTGISYHLRTDLGVFRDLNRHRPWSRFAPAMASRSEGLRGLINTGFERPSYLNNPKLADLAAEFDADMNFYYEKMVKFIEGNDPRLIPYLLPLGHVIDSVFHGNTRQEVYLTNLRVRPGGHINYREIANVMSDLLAKSSPLMRSLGVRAPNMMSPEEFLNRT